MKKRILSMAIIMSYLTSNIGTAAILSSDSRAFNYESGHLKTDTVLVDEGGDISVYDLYTECFHYWTDCYRYEPPKWRYTFKKPEAEIDIMKVIDGIDPDKVYYEQGVTLVKGTDYEVKVKGQDPDKEYEFSTDVAYSDTLEYTYEEKNTFTNRIDQSFTLDGNDIGEATTIEIPKDAELKEQNLRLEVNDIIEWREQGWIYKTRDGDTDLVSEYDGTSEEDGGSAVHEVSICVGPYPTIYYNAVLEDDNNYSGIHKDKLKILGKLDDPTVPIKMTCTYRPTSVEFWLCKGDDANRKTFTVNIDDSNVAQRADKMGYNVKIDPFEVELGENIDPKDNYYLRVVLNDGRTVDPDTTTPLKRKFAKFGGVSF